MLVGQQALRQRDQSADPFSCLACVPKTGKRRIEQSTAIGAPRQWIDVPTPPLGDGQEHGRKVGFGSFPAHDDPARGFSEP